MLRQISMVLTILVLSPAVLSAAESPCKTVEHSKASFDQSGEFQGCKLTKVDEDSLYGKLGLKVGDIVHPEGHPVKVAHKFLRFQRLHLKHNQF